MSRLYGVFVAFLAGGLLAAIGWFAFARLTAPPPLAELLPAESTYIFANVRTEMSDESYRDLIDLYSTADLSLIDLLDLESLGFIDLNLFASAFGDRIGVAFFGNDFDPQRFALIADVASEGGMREYLAGLALPDEGLAIDAYRGTTIFSYPRSRSHVFAFLGDDLIFAADEQLLKSTLDAADGRTSRIADTADYATVASRADPRSSLFAYLSPAAVHDLATRQFSGLDLALAGGVADLVGAGGVSGEVRNGQLTLTTFFAATPEAARGLTLTPQPLLPATFASLISPDLTRWYAGHDVLAVLPTGETPTALLIRGGLVRFAQRLLGPDASLDVLTPLLRGDIFFGQTGDGQLLLAAQAADVATAWQPVAQLFQNGDGLLARATHVLIPDGTTGERLVAARPTVQQQIFDDLTVHVYDFGGQVWRQVTLGDTLILASSAKVLADAIDALAARQDIALPLADTDDLFATTLSSNAALPWFLPFEKLVIGRDTDPSGLTVKMRFE